MKLLIINPGATSTKIAVFEDEEQLFKVTIDHSAEELDRFPRVIDQADYRKEAILKAVTEAGYKLSDFAAVCGRGGLYRAIQNGKAHPYKNVLDFVQGNIHGVLMSQLGPLTRDGYIHRLCFQAGLQLNFLNLFFLGVNLRGQSFPHFIGQLTNDRALFRAELSHLLEHSGEFSLFAQVFDPKCLQIHRFLGDGQGGQSLLFDLFQLFLHSASSQIKKPFLP